MFEGKDYRLDVLVNGAPVVQVKSEVHLGHRISPAHQQGADVKKGISDFWVHFNCFIARYGRFPSTVQYKLFNAFCMSLYGSAIFDMSNCKQLFTAHRKALRSLFRIPRTTHCDVINVIQKPTELILMDRFSKFLDNCLKLPQEHPVRLIMLTSLEIKSSLVSKNHAHCLKYQGDLIENVNNLIQSRGPEINVLFDM